MKGSGGRKRSGGKKQSDGREASGSKNRGGGKKVWITYILMRYLQYGIDPVAPICSARIPVHHNTCRSRMQMQSSHCLRNQQLIPLR